MLENLIAFVNRLEGLNQRMLDPVAVADVREYTELTKEHKNLGPIVEKYREYLKAVQTMEDSTEMLGEPGLEHEVKETIQQELDDTKDQVEGMVEELRILLLPRDPNDECSVTMEARGGAGGEEAMLFSARLFCMCSMYATRRDWKARLLSVNETELGGYKEVNFQITGDGAYSCLKYESSVHRVQCASETETQGHIHTSTATVAVLPEADDVETEINLTDLQIDTYRASGAGGQHVNKTESTIRTTYLPTGMVIKCQDERGQFKDKDEAMKVLRSRLYEAKQREQDAQVTQQRKSRVGTGGHFEWIRTYNFPQGRLIDHRVGLTIYRLEEMLSSDLDGVIDVLIVADRTRRPEETIDHQG